MCRLFRATISASASCANANRRRVARADVRCRSDRASYGLKRNFVRPRFAFALALRRLFWFGVSNARKRRTSSRMPSASSLFFSRFKAPVDRFTFTNDHFWHRYQLLDWKLCRIIRRGGVYVGANPPSNSVNNSLKKVIGPFYGAPEQNLRKRSVALLLWMTSLRREEPPLAPPRARVHQSTMGEAMKIDE